MFVALTLACKLRLLNDEAETLLLKDVKG